MTNQRAFPAGYELRKVCFRLDCTFRLWRNQLQNRQFPVVNELHLVEGRGHAERTAEKQPNLDGRRKKRMKIWRVHSTARKKLDLMRRQLGPTNDDTDTEQKRCFMELPSLQSLFTDVACGECGAVGSLDVSFGEKMGYSRQIRLVCQVCK